MNTNSKKIQLMLLCLGFLLLLSVYWLYPKIKEAQLLKEQKNTLDKTEKMETAEENQTEFTDVTYKGLHATNPFIIEAGKAKIEEADNDLVFMENMITKIYFKNIKWIIECKKGEYHKVRYDIFCYEGVKACDQDKEMVVRSNNLNLKVDSTALIYNDVIITEKDGSNLYADRVNYNFESKLYKIDMFADSESVKAKLVYE